MQEGYRDQLSLCCGVSKILWLQVKTFPDPISDHNDIVISSKIYVTIAKLVSFLHETEGFNVEKDTTK